MFSFQKPRYLKRLHPTTKKLDPVYQFDIKYNGSVEESPLSCIVDDNPFTLALLEEELKDQQEWWNDFLQDFLRATSSYFSKPYTVQQIQKIIRHRIEIKGDLSYPVCVCCVPQMMELMGGVLYVEWVYKPLSVGIDIPVEDLELPARVTGLQGKDDIVEWDVDAVPMTSDEKEDIQDGVKVMDKHRVREARLRAKLAVYRAQYQMNRFYDKYGDEVSDSDSNATSEAGSDWADEEEDEDEDEELQV